MAKICFAKNSTIIEAELNEPLMQILQKIPIPVASSCRGEAVCGKCKIQILEGQQYLNESKEHEKFLALKLHFKNNERLACQCEFKCHGAIKIDASYW
jgi:ferredoxin, 2Fe-2S